MINEKLFNPLSIAIIGGSNNIEKPGGKVLYNIINNNYKGKLFVVNPKETTVQGITSYKTIKDLPENIDLAIISIPANLCLDAVKDLLIYKGTKAFIILSAGFSEESEEGAKIEKEIVSLVNENKACLIGPNCIGVLTSNYAGLFTTPIPKIDKFGCDFISGSGATAVFIIEAGIQRGLRIANLISVGNSAQVGIEDVLEYFDNNFDPNNSSKIKILYLETIKNPQKLLKHSYNLIKKGCSIVAIKSGISEAGAKAAASHTGAMATPEIFVDALFKKAGIIRCYYREELTNVALILMNKKLTGKNFAIITHAGGPAVMLTDALYNHNFNIPTINSQKAKELLSYLHPASSVSNPIDFLATGTAEQLEIIIDYCENYFDNIDAMAIIFGSPGLFSVDNVYDVLDRKIKTCKKPIFPILPSVVNAKNEINNFINKSNICFFDEVLFANALAKVYSEKYIPNSETEVLPNYNTNVDKPLISKFLNYIETKEYLEKNNIPVLPDFFVKDITELEKVIYNISYPIVMKVVGPIHKTEVKGVITNIQSPTEAINAFYKLISIKDSIGVLIQQMLKGIELFIGAIYNELFGHLIMFGLGGIYVELIKDVASCLCPITKSEALFYLKKLKLYKLLEGYRGTKGINIDLFTEIIENTSKMLLNHPYITELDINPLIAYDDKIFVVDSRIKIN